LSIIEQPENPGEKMQNGPLAIRGRLVVLRDLLNNRLGRDQIAVTPQKNNQGRPKIRMEKRGRQVQRLLRRVDNRGEGGKLPANGNAGSRRLFHELV